MKFKEYIQSIPAYKPPQLTKQQPKGVVKLSSNENPLGPSPKALAAIQQIFSNIHRYPDSGSVALRTKLATKLEVDPSMILASNGSDEMVLLLCLAFLEKDDDVVMANGSFISYYLRTLELGANPIRVPLKDFKHDLKAMAQAITDKTKLVFICNPNNPTGTTNSTSEMAEFIQLVPEDVLIVVDEAYIEFVSDPEYPRLISELVDGRKNIILLRTFAKIYGLAGLRLGYAISSSEVISYLEKARPTFNVNSIAQAAGLAALDDGEFVAESREYATECRKQFTEFFQSLGLETIPSQTNFVAVKVGDDLVVTTKLMDTGFTVTPLTGWGIPGFIRVSFGTKEENNRFFEIFKTVI
jgi:histidinol-phosphate aminotransferase